MRKYLKFYCIIIVICVTIFGIVNFVKIYNKNIQYTRELKNVEKQIENEKVEQENLKDKQQNVTNTDFIEDVAREKMEMYRQNDVIFIEKSN